jgi:hypothetical protein
VRVLSQIGRHRRAGRDTPTQQVAVRRLLLLYMEMTAVVCVTRVQHWCHVWGKGWVGCMTRPRALLVPTTTHQDKILGCDVARGARMGELALVALPAASWDHQNYKTENDHHITRSESTHTHTHTHTRTHSHLGLRSACTGWRFQESRCAGTCSGRPSCTRR